MKNIILMGLTGAGLFSATVVGLLGIQGRLNHEGTKNIPVVNSFFPAPEKSEEGEKDAHGASDEETKVGHGEKSGGKGHETGAHGAGKAKPAKPEKPTIEYVTGKSINEPKAEAGGGHGGGHGDAATSDSHGGSDAEKKVRRTPRRPDTPDPEEAKQQELRREFDRRKEWLHSRDNRYRGPGELFEMPRIKAGMSIDEINSYVQRAQAMMKEIEMERAVLEKRRLDLDVRQRDIADRQARVTKLMNHVEAERTKVEQAVEDFNQRVKLIKPQEEAGLKVIASSVGSLSADAAKKLILHYWRTPEGQDKAIKILKFMEKDKVDLIIARMETDKMREILERRMMYVRSQAEKK